MKIETPEEMARRVVTASDWNVRDEPAMIEAIRADRKAIVAWCEEKADEADREAVEHDSHLDDSRMKPDDAMPHMMCRERCEGQASAFRALASILRGAR